MSANNSDKDGGHKQFLEAHAGDVDVQPGAELPGYADPDSALPHVDAVPTDWANGLKPKGPQR